MYDGLAGGYLGSGIDEYGNFQPERQHGTGFNMCPAHRTRRRRHVSFGFFDRDSDSTVS